MHGETVKLGFLLVHLENSLLL